MTYLSAVSIILDILKLDIACKTLALLPSLSFIHTICFGHYSGLSKKSVQYFPEFTYASTSYGATVIVEKILNFLFWHNILAKGQFSYVLVGKKAKLTDLTNSIVWY